MVVEAATGQAGRAHQLFEPDRLGSTLAEQTVRGGNDRFAVRHGLLLRDTHCRLPTPASKRTVAGQVDHFNVDRH